MGVGQPLAPPNSMKISDRSSTGGMRMAGLWRVWAATADSR